MNEIIISSENRLSGTIENFTITPIKATKIKLLEAYIPMTFNTVPAGDFTITGSISGANTISVALDRYTQDSMATYLQSLILAVKIGHTYTVTVDKAGRFVFTSTTETFSLDFTGSTIATYIGISGLVGPAASISGTSTTSKYNPPRILVCSNQIRGIDNGTIILNSTKKNILHAVPVCGTITHYRSSSKTAWCNLISEIDNFYLAFDSDLPVNLNGSDWSIKIIYN